MRGQGMVMPLARGLLLGAGLWVLGGWRGMPAWLTSVADASGTIVLWMTMAAVITLTWWNLAPRDNRELEEPEPRMLSPRPRGMDEEEYRRALEAVLATGTSRVRYLGPPPVITPPLGHLAIRVEPGEQRCKHDKDYGWTCEECGDAVPSGLRFCSACSSHGMPGYRSPWA